MPKSARSTADPRQFEKRLDLGLGAVADGHVAVEVQPAGMPSRQMLGQGRLGTEGLGEEDGRHIWVVMLLQRLVVRGLVFHAACPAVNMGGVGKEGEQGKVPWRHSPETGRGKTGRGVDSRLRFPHCRGDGRHLVDKRHPRPAQGGAEIDAVPVPGRDDGGAGQKIGQDGGGMEGAVAFAGTDIDVDPVQFEGHGIDHHGPQDSTVHPGQMRRRRVNILPDDGLVEIEDLRAALFEHADDRQGRNADDPGSHCVVDDFLHYWSCILRR